MTSKGGRCRFVSLLGGETRGSSGGMIPVISRVVRGITRGNSGTMGRCAIGFSKGTPRGMRVASSRVSDLVRGYSGSCLRAVGGTTTGVTSFRGERIRRD